MGDLEKPDKWGVSRRASNAPESGYPNPYRQSDSCPLCGGLGWIDVPASQGPRSKIPVLCICKEDADLERRIGRFNALPIESLSHMSFDSWRRAANTDEAFTAALSLASGEASFSTLVLFGQYGNGKTHLLVAITQKMTALKRFARYRYVPSLLQELRATFDRQDMGPDLAGLLESYGSHGLLGLDDLGAGKSQPSPWSIEQMEIIINERYESGKGLVVTTNLGVRELAEKWSPRIAERLFDRRTGRAKQVVMDAPSYRTGESW